MSSWFGMSMMDKAKPVDRVQAFITRMEPELVMLWEAWFKDNNVDMMEAAFETMHPVASVADACALHLFKL